MYTVEEYIAMGFDEETAKELAKANGQNNGAGSPFKKLSMNYSDIIADAGGVKKGNFIVGFVEDKKTLSLKEVGTDLGDTIEFFVVAKVYQVSQFDIVTNSNVFLTPLFSDPFTSKTQRDKKTGQTVEEARNQNKKVVFNEILLMMVKVGDAYEPYLHYLHGTSYNKLHTAIDALGVELRLTTLFKTKSVKVPTNFQPAWCFDIISATDTKVPLAPKETAAAIKAFNKWVDASNAQGAIAPTAPASHPSDFVEDMVADSEDDEISF